jgi:cell division protein ZapA (FtsZ GTPase activity inhibitor)
MSSPTISSSIEINICGQPYELKGEESEEHLREVAELVRRKVESLRKQNPSLTLQKAAILAAFDFASGSIKGRKKALVYRNSILSKAHELLDRMQSELTSTGSSST